MLVYSSDSDMKYWQCDTIVFYSHIYICEKKSYRHEIVKKKITESDRIPKIPVLGTDDMDNNLEYVSDEKTEILPSLRLKPLFHFLQFL